MTDDLLLTKKESEFIKVFIMDEYDKDYAFFTDQLLMKPYKITGLKGTVTDDNTLAFIFKINGKKAGLAVNPDNLTIISVSGKSKSLDSDSIVFYKDLLADIEWDEP